MKKIPRIWIAITLLMLLRAVPNRATAAEASSTFDTGYDGWSVVSFDSSLRWSWQPAGGNSGGFVQFRDNLSAPFFNFISSPASFGGDWSALDGIGELRYDFRLTGDSSDIRRVYVVVWGRSGGTMGFDKAQQAGDADGWNTITAPLVQSEWGVSSGSSWEDIMSDVSRVDIYPSFNGRDYGRVFAIDNIVLVPEPSTWALLLAGFGTLVTYGRCKKRMTTFLRKKQDAAPERG